LLAINDKLLKLLRVRVVLAPTDAPEDTRVLRLFHNRAELKKAFGDAQSEIHRLKDRVKLQEGATSRVKEQLEHLESRLGVPRSGMQALVHYQLRNLWGSAHELIGRFAGELASQREEQERRQFTADLNRQVFERQQAAKRTVADAERNSADMREKLGAVQANLAASRAWWQYFRRRELQRRRNAILNEARGADEQLLDARNSFEAMEREVVPQFPGLSLDARRAINLAAIAHAHIVAFRLAHTGLVPRAAEAMSRSEPREDSEVEGQAGLAVMAEIARAKALIVNSASAVAEVRKMGEQLRGSVRYQGATDTIPSEESTHQSLRGLSPTPEVINWDVLRQDLWSLSELLHQ
jgi:hypothetical protein